MLSQAPFKHIKTCHPTVLCHIMKVAKRVSLRSSQHGKKIHIWLTRLIVLITVDYIKASCYTPRACTTLYVNYI